MHLLQMERATGAFIIAHFWNRKMKQLKPSWNIELDNVRYVHIADEDAFYC